MIIIKENYSYHREKLSVKYQHSKYTHLSLDNATEGACMFACCESLHDGGNFSVQSVSVQIFQRVPHILLLALHQ